MTPLAAAALFSLALLAIVGAFLVIVTYNAVVALRLRIDKAWANVDVALKQRHDQLPSLVAAVRGVMAFEADVLDEVTRLRARYDDHAPVERQAATSAATSAAVRQLFAVVEAYPALRAAGNVSELQDEIARLEGLIADRRELYNDQVYRHNTRIQQVPAVFLAGVFGWTARPFFAAEGDERARPDAAPGARAGAATSDES